MHQSAAQSQFLLHTPRQRPRLTVLEPLYLRVYHLDSIISLIDGRTKQRGEELQVLLNGQILIEREPTRHIAHTAPHLPHLCHHVETIHHGRTPIGKEQRTKDAEHRCLSRTVRTDKAEHLALTHAERHLIECLHLTVTLRYLIYLDSIHNYQLKLNLPVHPDLHEPIVLDSHLDGIHQISPLIISKNSLGCELRA